MSLPDNNQQLDLWLLEAVGNDVDDFNPSPEEPDSMTIVQWLRAIAAMSRKIARYIEQREEAKLFYGQRVSKTEVAIEYLKDKITSFLKLHYLKNIATPVGTAYITHSLKRDLGENQDKLIEWAKEHCPAALSQVTVLDRRVLLQHVKETGSFPPDYTEHAHESLGIRT